MNQPPLLPFSFLGPDESITPQSHLFWGESEYTRRRVEGGRIAIEGVSFHSLLLWRTAITSALFDIKREGEMTTTTTVVHVEEEEEGGCKTFAAFTRFARGERERERDDREGKQKERNRKYKKEM